MAETRAQSWGKGKGFLPGKEVGKWGILGRGQECEKVDSCVRDGDVYRITSSRWMSRVCVF